MAFCTCMPIRYYMIMMVFLTTLVQYTARSGFSIFLTVMVMKHEKTEVPYCLLGTKTSNKTEPEKDTGPRYDFDERIQGHLFGSVNYGFVIGSAVAGFPVDWFGPYKSIFACTVATIIANTAIVYTASIHWSIIFIFRFIIGWCGATIFPAVQTLIGLWAPPAEKSRFVSGFMGSTLGTVIVWVLGAYVTYYWKWPWGFHAVTILHVAYLIVLWVFTTDTPEEHRWITQEEIDFIKAAQEGSVKRTKGVAPYKAILTSLPFWVWVFLHTGNLWGLFLQISLVPKYMKEYIGEDIKKSGVFAALPHLVRLFMGILYGWMGDKLKKKYRRVYILKGFVILSHIIPGILMILVATTGCNLTYATVLLVLSLSLNGAIVVTSCANPTDLSPNYAGSIFGVGSIIGGASGIFVPAIHAEFLMRTSPTMAWALTFLLGGSVYCGSGIFFIFFGSADIQPWNEKREEG